QLPREPRHRPPNQADRAPAPRADPRGRARRVHRGAERRGSPARARRVTIGEALAEGSRRLGAAGIDTARLDAELLAGKAVGLRRTHLYLDRERQLSVAEL